MKSAEKVFELVAKIPSGKVTTYGQIGRLAGIGPRQVGQILHRNTNPAKFPCHRVVKADGSIAKGYLFGGAEAQIKRLKVEGVLFLENGKIDLEKCLFKLKQIDMIFQSDGKISKD